MWCSNTHSLSLIPRGGTWNSECGDKGPGANGQYSVCIWSLSNEIEIPAVAFVVYPSATSSLCQHEGIFWIIANECQGQWVSEHMFLRRNQRISDDTLWIIRGWVSEHSCDEMGRRIIWNVIKCGSVGRYYYYGNIRSLVACSRKVHKALDFKSKFGDIY